jgi:hypothetical protein
MFSRRGSVGFVSLWVLAYLTRDLPATWPEVLGPREHDVFTKRPRAELDLIPMQSWVTGIDR